ncbi:MAG TPA: choice-of-anchor P family protein [Pseudonocardiaceae bacterium]
MLTARRGGLIGLIAATSLLAGTLPANAAPGDGSAYGLRVSVTLLGLPPVTVGPLVEANADGPTENTLAGANVPGVLSTGVITTSAVFDEATGAVNSRASTADVAIGLLPGNAISATAIEATCSAVQSGVTGTSTLADLNLGGLGTVPVNPAPNTVITVPGVLPGVNIATITFNEQISNPDGSLTVNAVHIRLLDGLGSIGSGDVVISSATCGPAGLPVPMASGAGLWLSLGVIGMAVLPVGVALSRRRRAAVTTT